ncbi:MAG: hypothetical protein FWF38_04705 [Spirochaetaceae bacterium]|nr:hypothetical protein [Spirochaetaceae bacterium]
MIKKIIALGFVMLFAGVSLFAIDITITPPTISGGVYDYANLDNVEKLFRDEADDALAKFDTMDNLVKAMSHATSYAADGATIRNFIGYKRFAIAVGAMGALQSSSFDISETANKVEDAQDIDFGINAQAVTVSVGVNLGFLVDGLYVSGKVGSFSFNIEDFDIGMFSCGLSAQYQLMDPKKSLLVTWKGLQVGTGFVYYKSDISFKTNASVTTPAVAINGGGGGWGTLTYNPTLAAKFETKGIKIPVDLMTGVRLAVLDISFGLGADINIWSKSDLSYKAEGETYLTTSLPVTATPGHAKVSGGTTGKSDIFKFKAMSGLGLSLGPVKLDVPITYYFGDGYGANVGVTAGVVF